MSEFSTLELHLDGAVARIWLNRPEMRNPIIFLITRAITRATVNE